MRHADFMGGDLDLEKFRSEAKAFTAEKYKDSKNKEILIRIGNHICDQFVDSMKMLSPEERRKGMEIFKLGYEGKFIDGSEMTPYKQQLLDESLDKVYPEIKNLMPEGAQLRIRRRKRKRK